MGSLSTPKRILLLTNSEHGQANVFLATSHSLLTLSPSSLEIHFASFPPIHPFILSTPSLPIIFHQIQGLPMVTAWSRSLLHHQPLKNHNIFDAINRMFFCLKVTLPWTPTEFLQIMDSIFSIIEKVQPDITAVDPAFSPALTVLRWLNKKFIVLSPNTIKDFSLPYQLNGEALWKYPVTGTLHTFPLPWYRVPGNVLLVLLAIICSCSIFDGHRKEIQKLVEEKYKGAKITTLNDLSLNSERLGVKILVANLKEIEFPLSVVPGYVLACGPIIRPAKKVEEVDAGLAKWLGRGKTVYINLGTHLFFDEERTKEMALGVKRLLDYVRSVEWIDKTGRLKGLQVLWKLNSCEKQGEGKKGRLWEVVKRVLGEEMEDRRVRVVEWIEAEPIAVLKGGNVVCAVHHGGANTFLETVSAGVPQVVLPVWMDTYDFARRAEYLGIGRWGNRQCGADSICKGEELGSVLIDVVVGGRWSVYADNAEKLAELCKKNGGGRAIAARHILAEMDGQPDNQDNRFDHDGRWDSI
ncbi:hypothetical protein QBC38DRAFT_515248 [Podospora fimiseda]|uniref:Erythromycin biosynthesis protein CIII-like C-terminal domain-containing protein n=1 Tax=Podospora fimiseda TaxID=252190 RepID=A0AAN7BJA4_9PEZI|nr:hypothetical protein QBC38DRAFT_515248 [Podospora fimiseda]